MNDDSFLEEIAATLAVDGTTCPVESVRKMNNAIMDTMAVVRQRRDGELKRSINEELVRVCQRDDLLRARILYCTLMDDQIKLYDIVSRAGLNNTVRHLFTWLEEPSPIRTFCLECIDHTNPAPTLIESSGPRKLELLREAWTHARDQMDQLDWGSLWIEACAKSELGMVQWIWEEMGLDLGAIGERALVAACGNRLEVAQWVHTLGEIDHHWNDEAAFRRACRTNLETAQWVWELGDVDHHVLDDAPFVNAIEHSLEAAQWVYSLGDVDECARACAAWTYCAEHTLFDRLGWLHRLDVYDEEVYDTMMLACRRLAFGTVEALCRSGGELSEDLLDRALVRVWHAEGVHDRQAQLILLLIERGADPMLCEQFRETRPRIYGDVAARLPRRKKSARS